LQNFCITSEATADAMVASKNVLGKAPKSRAYLSINSLGAKWQNTQQQMQVLYFHIYCSWALAENEGLRR
jgi:hypothetical protein